MSQEKQSGSRAVEWWREVDLKGQVNARVGRRTQVRSRVQVWLVRVSTSILLWACVIQLIALWQLWQPRLLRAWPPCFDNDSLTSSHSSSAYVPSVASLASASDTNNALLLLPSENVTKRVPLRKYRNNGYLLVSCNGGLNQMRAGICDMVAVARLLNLTLIIPELDKTSFWADPSDFGDIFDVDYFINSLRSEVRILNELPAKYQEKVRQNATVSMPPISWSNESYYLKQVLPLFRKHKVLHFSKTDSRLANSGLPLYLQKLRCHVNYNTLRFTSQIEELGRKLIKILRENGPFLVLHLRYEMDMLSFSGCTHGCTEAEADELTRLRYANTWWKEKDIDSWQRRSDGLCPLTPEETMLVLKALGFAKDIQIYIAAGEIYGGDKRMSVLNEAYPNIVRKEMLLSPKDLRPFQNHSSQMAALDYLVAIESDIFIPTYDGNMAKVVEGHRRYLDFRRTILLDRQRLVVLVDQYQNGTLQWDEFALAVGQAHETRMGAPTKRRSIPDRPKEEDYFYANPEECLS